MNQKKLSPAVIAVIVIVLVGMVAATAIIINQGNGQTGTTTQSSSDPATFANGPGAGGTAVGCGKGVAQ